VAPYAIGAVVAIVVVLIVAWLSDRRDRANGINPRVRSDALAQRRREIREQRANDRMRRRTKGLGGPPPGRP
jgi:sensor domain CHASE-containing protein